MRKNWKILLPVCTLAATATTLVPCLTSCGSNDSWGKAINLDEYTPETDPYSGGSISAPAIAALTLFGQPNSPDLIKQEMLWSLSINQNIDALMGIFQEYFGMPVETGLLYKAEKHECSISDIKVDYKDEYESGTVARISGKIKIRFVYEMLRGNDPVAKCTVEAKYKLKELPYKATKFGEAGSEYWGVKPADGIRDVSATYWSEELSLNSVIDYYASSTPDVKCSVNWTYGYRNLPEEPEDAEFNILFWPESYWLSESDPT